MIVMLLHFQTKLKKTCIYQIMLTYKNHDSKCKSFLDNFVETEKDYNTIIHDD